MVGTTSLNWKWAFLTQYMHEVLLPPISFGPFLKEETKAWVVLLFGLYLAWRLHGKYIAHVSSTSLVGHFDTTDEPQLIHFFVLGPFSTPVEL